MVTIKGKGGGGGAVVMGRVANGRVAEPGDVLVAQMTDPSMLKQIMTATAVVTDQGGPFCHAALVCNEMGIPFVVGTQIATKELADGVYVSVDPVNGTVELVEG